MEAATPRAVGAPADNTEPAAPEPAQPPEPAEAAAEAAAEPAEPAEPTAEGVEVQEPPTPKPKPKGRPKGSKTVNRRVRAEPPEPVPAAPPRVETPPDSGGAASQSDIFEIIRQRQAAQFERRQTFYATFLPLR